jgi:hypothetical protein
VCGAFGDADVAGDVAEPDVGAAADRTGSVPPRGAVAATSGGRR